MCPLSSRSVVLLNLIAARMRGGSIIIHNNTRSTDAVTIIRHKKLPDIRGHISGKAC